MRLDEYKLQEKGQAVNHFKTTCSAETNFLDSASEFGAVFVAPIVRRRSKVSSPTSLDTGLAALQQA